jgi:membrane protein
VIEFSQALLTNVRGGLIAGIGIALLFWTVIKVLGNIEQSFNDIWGVKEGRSLGRKISDYLSIMLICPLLLIMSSSLTVFITSQVTLITQKIALLGYVSGVIFFIMKFLPYLVVWVVFSFMYKFMPNTRVSFKASILAGVIAGTLYQIVQWIYIFFQIGVANYNAIYGSFAALPLFLVWLQVSWLVVLFGAEISFAVDNEETYEFEAEASNTSIRLKRLLGLRIVQLCEKKFQQAEEPLEASEIAHKLEAPMRLVREILYELVGANVLSEVKGGEEEERYQPAQDLENLTVRKVMDLLDKRGFDDPYLVKREEIEKLSLKLDAMNQLLEKSSENVLLKDL